MNEQPITQTQNTHHSSTFKIAIVVAIALLTGAVSWLVYRVEQVADNTTTTKATQSKTDETTTTMTQTTIQTGKGGFGLTVPSGWGPITKALDSDVLLIGGTKQPTIAAGAVTKVNTVPAVPGSDGAILFWASLDKPGIQPEGVAQDITIGKADEALTGKKYVYVYPNDTLAGIGYLRLANDRDYTYVFKAGDKELRVSYSVYGSDPRNQIETVDAIVQSIRVIK